MKYCRTCKTRAAESETVCSRCGQPLAVLGGASAGSGGASAEAAATQLTLQGQIRELEAVRSRNVRRSKLMALLAAIAVLAIVVTLYNIYSYTVLAYAVLENVTIEQDDAAESLLHISFDVVKPGKVSYDRRSGGLRTDKVDEISQPGRQRLAWAWPSSSETGVDLRVVYRGGLTRTSVDRHFPISGRRAGGMVDVVFVLDTTGSMDPFIDGLKDRCIEFAGIVREQGHDCRLGLIGFGDVGAGESMHVFDPTGELQTFQNAVRDVPRTSGGDDPESALEAVRRALQMPRREKATLCLVLITDERCHNIEQLPELADALRARHVVTSVVSRQRNANLYGPLCVEGGHFFAIEDARFDDILIGVAKAITSQIWYK